MSGTRGLSSNNWADAKSACSVGSMRGKASGILCRTLVQFQGFNREKSGSPLQAAQGAALPVRRREMTDRRWDSLWRVLERPIYVGFLMLRA